MPLRRAGTVQGAGVRYGPGCAAHRFAKSYALRCVRGTLPLRHIPRFRLALLQRRRLKVVTLHQRHLGDREQHGQRHHAERLEGHPEVGRLGAPDDFVQNRHRQKPDRPAQRQDAPALRRQVEHLVEQDRDEGAAEQQAPAEHACEQRIDDGRLQLDEGLVMQHERQRAEYQHHHRGDDRHHRHVTRHRIGRRHRHHHRHHECAGGDEQMEFGIGDEEYDQRPELGGELEQRMWLLLVHLSPDIFVMRGLDPRIHPSSHESFKADGLPGQGRQCRRGWIEHHPSIPAIALAKSRAVNGARSSMPSPTPMKCTGNLCFSASATRMPPRAVPSSLVMTSPVTPAVRANASTCDSAFCPTVASSTSSTACGAVASTFLITRTTFSSSFISSALFCRRPAVSISSTSNCCSRADVSALNARLAESEPCAPDITGDEVRSPQIFNCSIAAARNVSPAASITLPPSPESVAASLPMVVVLPEPLTPTTRITNGFFAASMTSGIATGASTFSTSVATTAFTSSGEMVLS